MPYQSFKQQLNQNPSMRDKQTSLIPHSIDKETNAILSSNYLKIHPNWSSQRLCPLLCIEKRRLLSLLYAKA